MPIYEWSSTIKCPDELAINPPHYDATAVSNIRSGCRHRDS